MLNEKNLLFLLYVIKYNKPIDSLISIGFEYSQIANFIYDLIGDGNLEDKDGKVILTKKGEENFIRLSTKKGNEQFFLTIPRDIMEEKINKKSIFLPSKGSKI